MRGPSSLSHSPLRLSASGAPNLSAGEQVSAPSAEARRELKGDFEADWRIDQLSGVNFAVRSG